MVLEHLFPESWLEKKMSLSFFLGIGFSLIGIVLAKLIFGSNSGIASVIFTSLLLIPSLYKLFADEEKIELKEKKFKLKELYKDNKKLIHAYIGMFMGVFVAYYLVSFFSLYFGWDVFHMFKEQLFLDPAIQGRATYSFPTFWSILSNNWWVLLASFFLALLSGNGAVFFVVWNASAWGAIFGIRAVASAVVLGKSPFVVAFIMQLITTPHILLEGSAYVVAGIAGAMISRDIISEAKDLKVFLFYLLFSIIGFMALNMFLKLIFAGPILIVLRSIIVLSLVYLLRSSFSDDRHKEVFTYNFWLFVVALSLFVIGAIVETGVLSWSTTLNSFYLASSTFFA